MTDDAPTIGLVLDCHDLAALAEFWSAALDYLNVGDAGAYVVLLPNGRPGPKLLLQEVPEPKTTKNRMHLDIDAVDTSRPKRTDSRPSPSRSAGFGNVPQRGSWPVSQAALRHASRRRSGGHRRR